MALKDPEARDTGGPDGAAPRPRQKKRGNYWSRRREMMYYRYILMLGEEFARDARSLIDVGSHQTSIAEHFNWIPERAALDLGTPYSSKSVRGIQADFLAYEAVCRYDFALCLQVLEHVPDAGAFAKKLLAVAARVLVSVPFKWPENANKHHCQDPVDTAKLTRWFGRTPDYKLIVHEPFRSEKTGRRLIAYFHDPHEPFDLLAHRRRFEGGR